MWCLKEGKEERRIVAVSMKERPKVRWLFVINKKEWRKEGKREPQEKADGKNAGSHPQSLHTLDIKFHQSLIGKVVGQLNCTEHMPEAALCSLDGFHYTNKANRI